jgi:hypothetical protein
MLAASDMIRYLKKAQAGKGDKKVGETARRQAIGIVDGLFSFGQTILIAVDTPQP